jgi:hypothetical protein
MMFFRCSPIAIRVEAIARDACAGDDPAASIADRPKPAYDSNGRTTEVFMNKHIAGLAAITAAIVAATPAPAQDRIQAGSLTCDVSAGIGLIIGSQRQVYCTFTPASPGPIEVYTGSITRIGLDLGVTAGGIMVWVVYAPSRGPAGALAGEYAGASGEASFVAGLGANVLIGGSGSTVALQPVSVQGQTGINLAAGIAGLDLRFVR